MRKRGAAKVVVLFVALDLIIVLAATPELLTYDVYTGGLMHAPALARGLAVLAAPFCLGLVIPLSLPLLRWRQGSARLLGSVSVGLALMPLPLHLLSLHLVSALCGVHFFWR